MRFRIVMFFRCFGLFFFSFLFISNQYGQNRFEFTPELKSVYQQILELKLDKATLSLKDIQEKDKENLIIPYLENYIDFFRIFIGEEKQQFVNLQPNKNKRLQQIKKGPANNPYYLFTQAEIQLQWALVRLKFDEKITALREINQAFSLLEENNKLYPQFYANKKSLGILHALVGTIPDNIKWTFRMFLGMTGEIDQGKKEIEEVLNYAKDHEFIYKNETVVMYSFLLLHLKNDTESAWEMIKQSNISSYPSPLATFAVASVAMRTGRNEEALQALTRATYDKDTYSFIYLDYLIGLAKLHKLDKDAGRYFLKYINNFKGNSYIKETYQKLAWNELIHDNFLGYRSYLSRIPKAGGSLTDEDKSAQREAESNITPHPTLLKARLLSDGGYYKRAYQLLQQNQDELKAVPLHNLEFTYRTGRVLHLMNQPDEALAYYKRTIEAGRNSKAYFPCNAALMAGNILEAQGKSQEAESYYKLCLRMDPDQYAFGLHQKAKAGLNRLGSK